jgi:hypothetical protein
LAARLKVHRHVLEGAAFCVDIVPSVGGLVATQYENVNAACAEN